MRDPKLSRLEEELAQIPGVTAARVVGDESPTEIHLVATPDRRPKQIVRDVQSLATARLESPIDHRIVSVVQLEAETPAQMDGRYRPAVTRLIVSSEGESGWVKVVLRWPDGSETEGTARAAPGRKSRARGAAAALVSALQPKLEQKQASVELDHLALVRLGSTDSVIVQALYKPVSSGSVRAVGSAAIEDDVATAAVRALLHALNRKLT